MKKFETVVILNEKTAEKDTVAFQKEFQEFLSANGGKILETVAMGKKQFSYPIKKRKTGTYIDFIYEISSDKASLPREKYKLDERVLRLRTYAIK